MARAERGQQPVEPQRLEAAASGARYRLPGGTVALPTLSSYLRALSGGFLWLGLFPLATRLAGRLGAQTVMHRLQRQWARALTRHLDITIDIDGLEHVRPGESYVVLPLHESLVDGLALLHLPLDLRFVVRDELFGWRLLGPYLRDTQQIMVAPERGLWSYRRLLRAAGSLFEAGESLVIFPQGSVLGIEIDFMPGAFALARACRRPLLPVALTGSHRVWEYPFTPRLRYGERVSLRLLPPVPVEQVVGEEPERLRRSIQARLKATALSGRMAPPRRFIPARDGYWEGYSFRIDPSFPRLAAEVACHRRSRERTSER